MKFITCFVSYFFLKEILAVTSRNNYFDGLIKYLTNSQLHQVVFILDDDLRNVDPVMNSLTEIVGTNFPSQSTSIKDMENDYFDLNHLYARTTLFVLPWNDEMFKMLDKVMMIKTFLEYEFIQRCLIVDSLSSTDDYLNSTLHHFWQSYYLDITILTYSPQIQEIIKTKMQDLPRLKLINPFTMNFSSQVVSSESEWFPNKIRDLNGSAFNFEFKFPTYRDDFNCQYDISRKITGIMEQAMNCKLNLESREPKSSFDKILHLLSVRWASFEKVPNVSIRKLSEIKAVIPNTVRLTKDTVVLLEFWWLLATIGISIIITMTVPLIKFKRSKKSSRIIFGSILITGLVCSGYFYSVTLNMICQQKHEILNLEQLFQSSLTIILAPNENIFWDHDYPTHIKRLVIRILKNVELRHLTHSPYSCLKYLAVYQNVSCLINNAEYHVNKLRSENKELNVKILPEVVSHYIPKWKAEENSPFIDPYNKIIQRATESGLMTEFDVFVGKSQHSLPDNNIEKNALLMALLYVAVIGYSLSIIVFLLEIFISCKMKRTFDLQRT